MHRLLAMSFRASDRCHWRGNPSSAPAGAEIPASLCEGGVMALGHDGGRDKFRQSYRENVRRGGALPLPPSHESTLDRPSVGGDAHAAKQVPLGCIAPHTAQRCHSEPVTDVTGVGIRIPAPAGAETPAPTLRLPSVRPGRVFPKRVGRDPPSLVVSRGKDF